MRLKESSYPVDSRGRPNLAYYADSVEYYVAMFERMLATIRGENNETDLVFPRQVHASWGLIAKGSIAIPYAIELMQRKEPEARETGAAILAELGKDSGAVEATLAALQNETDPVAKASLILAVGSFKNQRAIPVLGKIIRDEAEDGDTRWTAVEGLGKIVRKRFLRTVNPLEAAIAWLGEHES